MVNLSQKQLTILIVIGIVIILIIGYYIYSITSDSSYEQIEENVEQQDIKQEENVENQAEEIVIHIAGQVKNPGIVRIKEGARIADIIEKAGGLTQEANIENVNLAYIVEDGQKIIIPSKKDTQEKEYVTTENGEDIISESAQTTDNKSSNSQTNTSSSKVNINKANKEELQTLSGIGESTANKIIEYRKEHGEFKTIEDIKNVSGIGEAKYEQIKENIKIK